MTNANPVAPVHFKPFNFEHAKLGAPVGRMDGKPIRIITFDKISHKNRDQRPILALVTVTDTFGNKYEEAHSYSSKGSAPHTSRDSDLVMLPLTMIADKPVFVGDELESAQYGRWTKFSPSPIWSRSDLFEYRWPKTLILHGKEVTPESKVWHNPDFPRVDEWSSLTLSDKCPYYQYSKTHFEVLLESTSFHKYYQVEKPKVKKEVWQVLLKKVNSPGVIYGPLNFPSKEEADKHFSYPKDRERIISINKTDEYYE